MRSHTALYVPVLLLHMCPHAPHALCLYTATFVGLMPDTAASRILLYTCPHYYYICVLMLLIPLHLQVQERLMPYASPTPYTLRLTPYALCRICRTCRIGSSNDRRKAGQHRWSSLRAYETHALFKGL